MKRLFKTHDFQRHKLRGRLIYPSKQSGKKVLRSQHRSFRLNPEIIFHYSLMIANILEYIYILSYMVMVYLTGNVLSNLFCEDGVFMDCNMDKIGNCTWHQGKVITKAVQFNYAHTPSSIVWIFQIMYQILLDSIKTYLYMVIELIYLI